MMLCLLLPRRRSLFASTTLSSLCCRRILLSMLWWLPSSPFCQTTAFSGRCVRVLPHVRRHEQISFRTVATASNWLQRSRVVRNTWASVITRGYVSFWRVRDVHPLEFLREVQPFNQAIASRALPARRCEPGNLQF